MSALEAPARRRWRPGLGRSLIAVDVAGEVLLGKQKVRLCCALDDRKERRHARDLFSLFGQEPMQVPAGDGVVELVTCQPYQSAKAR
jgi:hypothetical protein